MLTSEQREKAQEYALDARAEAHTCNNGEPCLRCHAEGNHTTCYNEPCEDKEEKNAASRERESNLARRVVIAQNDIISAALDLATRPTRL